MTEFTPVTALIGGALIGFASLILLLGIGRIAGISGIFASALEVNTEGNGWRWSFLAGLVATPLLLGFLGAGVLPTVGPGQFSLPGWLYPIAGLLVGLGVKIGGGCTSGHGICGIGRLSIRSIVATCVFMAVAVITVFLLRHVFTV